LTYSVPVQFSSGWQILRRQRSLRMLAKAARRAYNID